MSWIDNIKTTLTIITGDGEQYTPNWKNAKVVVPYNVSEFNFPNVEGTYVDKREQLGSKFALELYFQGDNHLEDMKNFVFSAKDKRPWTIIHPFYDVLNVQPSALNVDNSDLNISKITITATQTIERVNPRTLIIPVDKIDEDVETTNSVLTVSLEDPDKTLLTSQVLDFSVKSLPKIENDLEAQEFINKTNIANDKIANIAADKDSALIAIQDLLLAPSLFTQSVDSRLNMISTNFDTLVNQITGTAEDIKNLPNDLKTSFEMFGASLITSLCSLVSLPTDSDYDTRVEVNTTIEKVLTIHNTYVVKLDELEIGTGGNPQDYQPTAESIILLNNLVNYTVANLFDIAKDSKQERSEIIGEDSDFITLSHRFYGMDFTDTTIDELISNNSLGLNGLINIKKGTKIIYYI